MHNGFPHPMPRIRSLSGLALVAALLATLPACTTLKVKEGDSAETILEKAAASRDRALYSQAISNYQKLESFYPYSREAIQAQLEIPYTYYLKGDAMAAVQAADRFLRLHPRSPHADYAQYLKGVSRYAQIGSPKRDPEQAREAVDAFARLANQYPDSPFVPDARQRTQKARAILARHELHVARYYFDRGAYVAAANRCHRIIRRYQDNTAVEPALGLLTRTYARLRLRALAEDTLAILEHNFPDSGHLGTARNAVQSLSAG
jgi:outer membrane protein assembly factor BamD